ncbi:hypothetical protein JAAARDRAFT_210068 [Jaapia argillacea MUCL 33604]|uniref:F-box domain-containing protein n=1 Tax=Jaapia argillacea MUCL 33604 TaxID=933084 RepID=A0A067PSY4_9AGAM|nr:hypothetical protein JAAARDRAFT_210068 [Jaapia argillacea MUCL 33604]
MSYARVFSIAELFREICWHLNRNSKHSLANLAQTCRSSLEPALDVLWYKMLGTEPLLKLIPALEVSYIEIDYRPLVSYYETPYPLEEEHWSRFDYYARRIRILEFDHNGDIDCDIYSRLSQHTTSPNLIPSLRSFIWVHKSPYKSFASFTAEVSPFFTPSLQTIYIRNYCRDSDNTDDPEDTFVDAAIQSEEEETLRDFFHMLPRRCPAVESLTIGADLHDVSFGFLAKLQSLRVVSLRGLSTEGLSTALEALSVLPRLEKIDDFELLGGPGVVSCTPGFASSSDIFTSYGNPTTLLAILRCLSSPFLLSFSSICLTGGSNQDFLSCASLLVSKFSTTLQRVMIDSILDYPVETVGQPIFEILSQGLPNLRTFQLILTSEHIDHSEWPTLTDDQVERMTLSWPNMKDLTIQHSISLQSLKTITRAWPNLTLLKFSTLYIRTPDLQFPYKPHALRKLSVSKFRHSDPAASTDDIARIIHAMFPRLEIGLLAMVSCDVMGGVVSLQSDSAETL